MDLLTGPKDALKQFANVEFNIFDLPSPFKGHNVMWEAEVFLGVNFLRNAGALRLADGFAGNGALEGLSVLVREIKGYNFSSSAGEKGEGKKEEWEKDEL